MKSIIIMSAVAVLLGACGNKESQSKTEEEHHVDEQTSIVTLTGEQMKTAGIELGSIALKNLKTSIRANGMLTVPNQNKALVTSVTNGVIRTLLVQPGNFVNKGQTIATIINPDVARLQQDLQTTIAQIHLNEIELKRQQELVEGNAAPLKNVQRVQTELATLRSARNALEKQLKAMGISSAAVAKGDIVTTLAVRAPISGAVSNVLAQIGSNVDPSTPIAEIVNNSQLHLDLFVYEKDLPKLHVNQTIHFTLTNNPGKEYDAKIYSIGTAFASESKTIPVHAVVEGDKAGLIEGMNITAVISMGELVVPAVPNDAIVSYQGQDYLFVLNSEKNSNDINEDTSMNFDRVQVVRGVSDIGYTEVTPVKNLRPDCRIIAKGAFFANAKMTNSGEHDD